MVTHFSPSLESLYLDHYCNPLVGLMTCSGDDVNDSQGSLHLKVIRRNKKVASHGRCQRATRSLRPGSSAKVLVPIPETVVYEFAFDQKVLRWNPCFTRKRGERPGFRTLTFLLLGTKRKKPPDSIFVHVCARRDVFAEGDGELPATQLPLLICSNFISIC